MSSDVTVHGGMGVGLTGGVNMSGSLGINGIPNSIDIGIKDPIPKITIETEPVDITLTLKPITVEPVSLNLAITEVPEMRTHLPADFTVGLAVLGMQLISIRLCGEAQMINEAFRANPCEHCGAEGVEHHDAV